MFERAYTLVSLKWTDRAQMSARISDAITERDCERAAASIACMSSDRDELHILIEHWRLDGNTEQDTTGAVDEATAARKPRRRGARQDNHARAAESVEPQSLDLPMEPAPVISEAETDR